MFHKRPIKEKLLKGGAWSFTGRVATAFTALAVNALLARLLVPEDLGAYFLILSLVSVAAIVAQLGLTQTIVRLVAESLAINHPARARLAVRLAIRMAALGALLMACLLAFGGGAWLADHFFHSQIMSRVMGLAAVWVVINTFQQLIVEVYRGFHDIRLATIFGGLVTGLLAMLIFFGLWLLQGHSDLRQVILLMLIAGCSSLTLSSLVLWKKLGALPAPTGAHLSVSEIMKISWPLWVSNVMLFATLQADIWVVGFFLTEDNVALYGAAARLVALLMITSTILYAVLPPMISEMKINNDLQKLQSILTSTAFGNSVVVFPLFLCFVIFSAPVLELVYGEYYVQGEWVLSILAIGLFFNVVTGVRGTVLMVAGYEKKQMLISIIGGVLNIFLCSVGAWSLGLNGVAIGAMAGMILQCVMELIAVKRALGIWTVATPVYIKEFLMICSK